MENKIKVRKREGEREEWGKEKYKRVRGLRKR
jgi:hypothetical protein